MRKGSEHLGCDCSGSGSQPSKVKWTADQLCLIAYRDSAMMQPRHENTHHDENTTTGNTTTTSSPPHQLHHHARQGGRQGKKGLKKMLGAQGDDSYTDAYQTHVPHCSPFYNGWRNHRHHTTMHLIIKTPRAHRCWSPRDQSCLHCMISTFTLELSKGICPVASARHEPALCLSS